MEGADQRPARKCFCRFPKLRLWILEHVWVHKPTDLHQVLDLIMLPEMDLQPLSLEDSWQLRVASAQVYSIVKNRDVKNFERVLALMENVYRLLPGLVSPIKHMKIVFGLKTLFIMWMLRECRGMVETMLKINQFFPNKLPQYQGQCSQRDMFLMIRNHVDFRSLAQALTVDRAKLKDYISYQMEEQYGEHYAQKVEDRLLHYLNELETMLPGKTHIEQILDRRGPVTEEERLLLEVVTADSASIGTTVKTLLHCDVVCCGVDGAAQSPEHGTTRAENSPLSKDLFQTSMVEVQQDRQQVVHRDGLQSIEGAREHRQATTHRRDVVVGHAESLLEATAPPQFCFKHGQWVETILQHCTDQTEELTPAPASPLLFLSSSSSSGSSSDDLTPSNLVPQHAPSQSSSVSGAAAEMVAHTSDKVKPSCGWTDDASQTQGPLQPFSSVHICPTKEACDLFAPIQASPEGSSNSTTIHNGARDGKTPMQTPPASIGSRQPPTPKSLHEATRMFRHSCPAKRPLQALQGDSFESPSFGFMTSCSSSSSNGGGSGPLWSTCTSLPQCSAHHAASSADKSASSTGSCRRPQRLSAFQLLAGTDSSLSSDSVRCESSPVQRPQLKMSLSCQAALLQSKLFQPYVSLTRLRSERRSFEPGRGEEEDSCCSFDPNTLYSSYSSSSGGDDSLVYDPDYKPRTTKKQLLLEYEAARTLI